MTVSEQKRRDVYYRGRVQGVGFRYTAQAIAQRYPVTGFVKNLPDGRVQLVAEGEPADLDALLEDVAREMAHFIQDTQVVEAPASGGFDGFQIRM
jgi:acylphosphatase